MASQVFFTHKLHRRGWTVHCLAVTDMTAAGEWLLLVLQAVPDEATLPEYHDVRSKFARAGRFVKQTFLSTIHWPRLGGIVAASSALVSALYIAIHYLHTGRFFFYDLYLCIARKYFAS